LYSVVMALDSVETSCDIEIGGIDQFLNMQMCRKVMEICGQSPELVVATSLIEGIDGTGAKMSKSRGNYVPLTADAGDIFGKLMSVPDRLVDPYLRALSEWDDTELAVTARRLQNGTLHPMDLKKILAGEVTAAVHGIAAAMAARQDFGARFSRRAFGEVEHLPIVVDPGLTVTDVVRALGFATSSSDVRRVAKQHGLRLVLEMDGAQEQLTLDVDEAQQPLTAVVGARIHHRPGAVFLKFGRKLARVGADS